MIWINEWLTFEFKQKKILVNQETGYKMAHPYVLPYLWIKSVEIYIEFISLTICKLFFEKYFTTYNSQDCKNSQKL